jgi:hypothetical protein
MKRNIVILISIFLYGILSTQNCNAQKDFENFDPVTNAVAVVVCSDVTLSWQAPSVDDDLLGYTIIRNGQVLIDDLIDTTYYDEGLLGGYYVYGIIANYQTGSSDAVEVSAEVDNLLAPDVNATANNNSIVITWGFPSPGVNPNDDLSSIEIEGRSTKEVDQLIGFRIERINVETGEIIVLVDYFSGFYYVDFDIPNGVFIYIVTAIYSGDCIVPSSPVLINFSDIAAVQDESLNVYPNPATNFITVESPYELKFLQIRNVSGQIVSEINNLQTKMYNVGLDEFESGVYHISVMFDNGQICNSKILITK